MQANNTLSLPRLGLLFRQGFIHNYKMIAISLVAFCGGLFLLLLTIHLADDSPYFSTESFSGIFLAIVIPLSIVYAGTAFPGLRSKEKSYSYLLTPVSALEKFLFEFFNRVLLFLVTIPLLYWIIFHLEGSVVTALAPERYSFTPKKMIDLLAVFREPGQWDAKYAVAVAALLIFTVPFAGAASFTKLPLLKTLFIVALLFFFNFFIIYLFAEVVGVKDYELPEGDKSILFIEGGTELLHAMTGYGMIINIGLLLTTYFKLREKEV
jgi:hypothetical protein